MATSAPGRIAGIASSTTITRLSVEVVRTTIAPRPVWTRPSRTMPNQDSVWIIHGYLVHDHPALIAASANAVISMPTT